MFNNLLDLKNLNQVFSQNKSKYGFGFVVIDDCIDEVLYTKLLNGFPNSNKESSNYKQGYLGQYKNEVNPNTVDEDLRNSVSKFLQFEIVKLLEHITSIEGIIVDPSFLGGGFHQTFRSGKLGMHTDFRIHETLKVERKLNFILYLNEEWRDDWNGALSLADKNKLKIAKIYPIRNRAVLMETNSVSWHGHPEELNTPENISRKSLALYYYVSLSEKNDIKNYNTIYTNTDGVTISDRVKIISNNLLQIIANDYIPPILLRLLKVYMRKK